MSADSYAHEIGDPVDAFGWPIWPRASKGAVVRLEKVLSSGRWSISGFNTGSLPMEREFAARFAAWMDVPHCVPTASGTAALVAALEALDVGAGDEVIVPGLTWVAPAIAVLQVNAHPVIADIDLDTLCIAADSIERLVTARTRAIILVHLYASLADLDRIMTIARRRSLHVIEDCAQSHGSIWRDRKVGAWGDIGIFSMHQGKPLTCGEGGAAVTADDRLAVRLEQLRANGRQYRDHRVPAGEFDLAEVGSVLGTNRALSEFQAAVLLDGMDRIDAEIGRRSQAAAFLDGELSRIAGLRPIARPAQVCVQSYYHYVVRFVPDCFGGRTPKELAEALTRELGCLWQPTYVPLPRHPLFNVELQKRYAGAIGGPREPLPHSEQVHATSLIVHHRVLLADRAMLQRIPEAFAKFSS